METALFYINGGDLKSMVEENALIVIARKGCCMCHVVLRLLHFVGANPALYEVDEREAGELAEACGAGVQLPAVFMGGRWFGGLERLIATHITEELTPLLKKAGALWL